MATILIVEDRPIDRKLLLTVLRSGGHHVLEASDGGEALKLVRRHRPDLVISDILMPTVDGYEFVRRLRAAPEIADTPVLFYTATYHEREARALAERCGVIDILTKPSRPEVILDTITRVLVAGRSVPASSPDMPQFEREHLQLVSTTLAMKADEAEAGKQRIAAIVDIAQQIAAEHDSEALLQQVCAAARDVTFAQHATLFLLDDSRAAVRQVLSRGVDRESSAALTPPPVETPLVRTLIEERRPFRAENADGRPESLGLPGNQPPIHSLLCVPIASSTRVYGWLALRNKLGASGFTQADEEFAATLGTHAAVAYENAQLYDDLRRHVAALEQEVVERRRAEQALRHRSRLATFSSAIGTALTSSRSVPEMLDGCAQACVQHLEAALARIWILLGDQILEMRATAGPATPVGDQSLLRLDDGLIGAIARERRPTLVTSFEGEKPLFDAAWARREKIAGFAGYPLMVDERLVGVLAVFPRLPLTREAIDALEFASGQIALGIERRQVEERLRENQERTRFALGAARMGVWQLHLASDRMTWSETLAPVFGLAPESSPANSASYFALIHPDDRDAVASALRRAIRDGREYSIEFRVIWPDRSLHWVDERARVLLDEFGRADRVLGVAIDVSDRKLLEQQFRQAQKMEGIGQLAGGVAHDFNNLITAILGYAALITETLDANDPRRADVNEIVKATDRASGLTRQLLAFSRRQVLEPTVLSVNALIADMSQMLGRLIGEDIDLVSSLDSDLAPVRADAGQLEQVILNLVVNARDAMPTGGRLTIETANVDLGDEYVMRHAFAAPGRYVMLALSDTGIGMDEETRTRLFEPFFTTKEKGKGTGLGLATVYGIVKQSGGYIFVYSEPGHGATFKVYLPRVEGESVAPRPAAADTEAPAGGTETILLVEDEEAVRVLARIVLERAGYHIIDAEHPDQAERLFREHAESVTLLLTDVVMPGSGGPALFEKLSALNPRLKVVYMSGYTDDSVVRHGKVDAGVAFLQKPFIGEKLLRKVREVLDR